MNRINDIIDKASTTHNKTKILCRNSYERRMAHEYAEQKGLCHRSIIDYTQMHINQDVEVRSYSGCCRDCDRYTIKISGTPYSYVQINNGYDKEIIGNAGMIPEPLEILCGGVMLHYIKQYKKDFIGRAKSPTLVI